ncbi:MAG: tetratricopeptide repeat protein [Burkholderiaceae bacterium]
MSPTRKLAAILSADVAGYSRLMGEDERATFDAVLGMRARVRALVEAHAGRVVDATGDAVLAEFASAVEALRCACEVQRAQATHNAELPESRRMLLRIGLNLGDVIESDGALYGDGVNIAARVQGAGEPGGVCVSGAIREQVAGKLALRFDSAGELRFKNIAQAVPTYHVRERSDTSAPAATAFAAAAAASHLPQPLSSFVGRAGDLVALERLLQSHRLVTLVGPGGIGKTRLAVQAARQAAGRFTDGVWLVELAALADARLVAQVVASTLGIKPDASASVMQTLASELRPRRLLIVLDNCEHLLQACAELTRSLLETAPQLVVLASSREALRLAGEASYPVPALALPDANSALPAGAPLPEAVQLFVDRAGAARPGFAPTAQNWPAMLSICRRLDGIPLAIELAAARVRALSVEHIAARLNDRFHLLTHGDRAALPRQQTLRALIDWSHDLLTERERLLLRRLAVFAGGWTLEACEAVCTDAALERQDVADVLGCLVDRSMVEADVDGARYRLLQTVRQYAQERLEESGEAGAAKDRHLQFFIEFAETAGAGLTGSDQGRWIERLDPERENFLIAHAWCDPSPLGAELGLRMMFALKLYLFNRGLLGPLLQGVQDALARPGAERRTIHRCRALQTAGQAGFMTGRFASAKIHLEEALAIAEELGDTGRAASVLQTLGMTCVAQGEHGSAHRYLDHALTLAQQRGDRRELAAALNALAQLHRVEGTLDRAQSLYEQALLLTRELGDLENTAVALLNLALVAVGRIDAARAAVRLIEALEIAESIGSMLTGANGLAVAAGVAALREEWQQSIGFATAARTQMQAMGLQLDPADEMLLAPLAARSVLRASAESGGAAGTAAPAPSYALAMAAARKWLISS